MNNNEHLFCEGQDCIEGIWSASWTAEREVKIINSVSGFET